jgi:2-phosphosulfolactate phosphatase
MEISIHSLLEGATRTTGSVAVIDVFRAFTTAAVALANGASKIVMVRTVKEALELRQAGIGEISMGEVHGRAPDGFDFGNSPFEVSTVDFQGKTIIQRTSAGTQGIVEAATKAERLYAASLVTAEATVRALLSASPDQISLVAMGDDGLSRTDEDELCAIHLRNRLEGRPGDPEAIRRLVLAGGESRVFTIRPVRICTQKTLKSRSTSTGSISRSESSSRTGDRSRIWRGQPDAEGRGASSAIVNVPRGFRG